MNRSSISPIVSGFFTGFALLATCIFSSGCTEFQKNRATAADNVHPRYPSVVVTFDADDRDLDWDVLRQSDSLFWQDVISLEKRAMIWRVNFYKHVDGSPVGKFMDWTDITTRKVRLELPLDKLLRAHIDFCTTKDPNDASADCDGRQINILLHKYPD